MLLESIDVVRSLREYRRLLILDERRPLRFDPMLSGLIDIEHRGALRSGASSLLLP